MTEVQRAQRILRTGPARGPGTIWNLQPQLPLWLLPLGEMSRLQATGPLLATPFCEQFPPPFVDRPRLLPRGSVGSKQSRQRPTAWEARVVPQPPGTVERRADGTAARERSPRPGPRPGLRAPRTPTAPLGGQPPLPLAGPPPAWSFLKGPLALPLPRAAPLTSPPRGPHPRLSTSGVPAPQRPARHLARWGRALLGGDGLHALISSSGSRAPVPSPRGSVDQPRVPEAGQDAQRDGGWARGWARARRSPVELVDHGGLPVAPHHHLLLLQLLRHLQGTQQGGGVRLYTRS